MNDNRLHLIRIFGCAALFLQGILCLMWWLKMSTDPSLRAVFVWEGVPDSVFFAFLAPDILLYAGGSILSAYGLSHSRPWTLLAVGVMTGAVLYAEGLAIGLSVMTDSAWIGAALMAPSVLLTLFMAVASWRMEVRDVLRR